MSEYWLISVPVDKTRQETWKTLDTLSNKQKKLSTNYKFNIPDLKVCTLDQLVKLSDDFRELDDSIEKVTHRIARCFWEILEDKNDILEKILMCNNTDLNTYITKYQWDIVKFPKNQSFTNILDILNKTVIQLNTDLKEYICKIKSLKNLEEKKKLPLQTRSLIDIVKKDDLIMNSEYLTTLLVVVPRTSFKVWKKKYEKLTEMVVPRSSQLLFKDQEHGLFTVVLFKRDVDTFKEKAIEWKFLVRDFTYKENEALKLETDMREQSEQLIQSLKETFSQCFSAWIHTKAFRVFVESAWRYGPLVNFQAILLHPQERSKRRLRDLLHQLYGHLDPTAPQDNQQSGNPYVHMSKLPFVDKEYYPYVYYKININITDNKYFKLRLM